MRNDYMVVGNGLLAKKFASYQDNDEVLIFASGVSDSKTTDPLSFQREEDLLIEKIKSNQNILFVYFSTSSVNDESVKASAYVKHKLAMETVIQKMAPIYLIFRLSNVVGNGGNSKTVFNFLFHQINNGQQFELWSKSYRNIIDIDDAFLIIDKIIKSGTTNQIVNIASPFSKSISKIVESIEEFTGNKAIFQAVDKGTTYEIDTSAINQIIGELEIDFDKDYLQKILSKYYNDEL